jgi:hypothetical protein
MDSRGLHSEGMHHMVVLYVDMQNMSVHCLSMQNMGRGTHKCQKAMLFISHKNLYLYANFYFYIIELFYAERQL